MVRTLRRVVIAVGITVLAVAVPLLGSGEATGKTLHHAGVVVQHSQLGTLTACVAFKEQKLDGVELLRRSHFDFRAAHFSDGTGICWIDGEGCKTTSPKQCFCTPASGVTASWSYFVQESGGVVFQPSGTYPSGRVIRDGSMDYWTFGPYLMPPAAQKSVKDVCGP
jgi:hypothetical protein